MDEINMVTVVVYGGETASKVLVHDLGEVLLVTTRSEWEAAQSERREPVTVGFKREYLI
jgi:hypothetical protein